MYRNDKLRRPVAVSRRAAIKAWQMRKKMLVAREGENAETSVPAMPAVLPAETELDRVDRDDAQTRT